MATRNPRPLFLVAVDGSLPSDRALRYALNLARGQGAAVRIMTVTDRALAGLDAAAGGAIAGALLAYPEVSEQVLARGAKEASATGVEATTLLVLMASPAAAIVREAKACGAALLVVGSRGRTGLSRVLLGSVAEAVVRHAPCPVLVVH